MWGERGGKGMSRVRRRFFEGVGKGTGWWEGGGAGGPGAGLPHRPKWRREGEVIVCSRGGRGEKGVDGGAGGEVGS